MNLIKKILDDVNNKDRFAPVAEPEELPVMVQTLMGIDDYRFGAYAFSRDPMRGRFEEARRKELTWQAMACAQDYAEQLRREYRGRSCRGIAGELGLKVLFPETPVGGGNVLFAQFREPDEISVFSDCVTKARAAFAKYELPAAFRGTDLEEMLIAHELFHFLEYRDCNSIMTRVTRAPLWSFAGRTRTANVVALGEIAGMTFAKAAAKLTFSPYAFDVFFVYLYNKQAAFSLYREILKLTSAWEDDLKKENENAGD